MRVDALVRNLRFAPPCAEDERPLEGVAREAEAFERRQAIVHGRHRPDHVHRMVEG